MTYDEFMNAMLTDEEPFPWSWFIRYMDHMKSADLPDEILWEIYAMMAVHCGYAMKDATVRDCENYLALQIDLDDPFWYT